MTLLANRPVPKKTRLKPQRFFGIRFVVEGDTYTVSLLPIDPAVGRKAFRFAKQTGDGARYDIHFDPAGRPHCECRGFLRWGKCKHVQTIQAAEKVFNLS